MHWRILTAAFLIPALLPGPVLANDAGAAELNLAYKALEAKDYDTAISSFRAGLAKQPTNAAAHKDLAYTLLKTGDNAEARDEFQSAMKLDIKDETAALEYAFLAFETKQPIAARRMFDRLRKSDNAGIQLTAERAFQNIDQPLAASIARWKQAIAQSDRPNDVSMFSAHWELAQTAELRDDLPIAATEYEICWQMKPQLSEILMLLAHVWRQQNRLEEANAALLSASRSGDSRSEELALEALGPRYPYPYEFVNALKLDPKNLGLRKELAYLYLVMHRDGDAIDELEKLLQIDPADKAAQDQLDSLRGVKKTVAEATPVLKIPSAGASGASPGKSTSEARELGLKSFGLGYTNDAIRYLSQAHEANPLDDEVTLKLAWALNQTHRDQEAVTYFALASKSADPKIAAEATKAFHALNGDAVAQTTTWALPMYSTRWHDLFTYGQMKHTLPLPRFIPFAKNLNDWVSFYVSSRFMGDVKSTLNTHVLDPQYLSETSFIFGIGAASKTWHHLTGFVEAGEAVSYLPRKDVGVAIPDYRGGVNFAKGFGELLGSSKSGMFYETTADVVYVSRFDKDWLFYSQNRAGRTIQLGGENKMQLLINGNVVRDAKNQYWANAMEFGPGIKIHPAWLPPNVYFTADFLRGVYLENLYNPRRPNYYDARLSFWYARTK